ncbi:NYN domain-containing protein [Penicillium verhagenii]|uniref:NYN domain-containing protein n=1 Tax=Penicillium verhagenii TaxID=1562060 RepID=UPI0025457842|nr:NYN domain-containing protein [Penicillium verhagenii]KAJ5917427.1 NYN domain-containing protein [Penicillium verhagenii]
MAGDTIPKLAVLIDADNARYSILNLLLSEIAKYGTAHAKRAYGDWSSPDLQGWKDVLLKQSVQPIQQFAYTHGKNATDSAMIIDAMDLLYSSRYDGFCLVSSDSDFTRLAARIREAGLIVYGLGERKTPQPFVAACDKFIYTENLVHVDKLVPHSASVIRPGNPSPGKKAEKDEHLADHLRTAVEASSNDDGWAMLSDVGNLLTKKHPDFDSRTYGYHKLSDLITALSSKFETSRRSLRKGSPTEFFVRDKHRKPENRA